MRRFFFGLVYVSYETGYKNIDKCSFGRLSRIIIRRPCSVLVSLPSCFTCHMVEILCFESLYSPTWRKPTYLPTYKQFSYADQLTSTVGLKSYNVWPKFFMLPEHKNWQMDEREGVYLCKQTWIKLTCMHVENSSYLKHMNFSYAIKMKNNFSVSKAFSIWVN